MFLKSVATSFILSAIAATSTAQSQLPPPQAFDDCRSKKEGGVVQHKTRDGFITATCVQSPRGLHARPNRDGNNVDRKNSRDESLGYGGGLQREQQQQKNVGEKPDPKNYTLEQAISDRAQLNTIAFDGLAFLTGDFGYDTFLPPGKVSDYFGFQYMRDIDQQGAGHNTNFLTKIAFNMLSIMSGSQKAQLIALAKSQEKEIRQFAEMRFPLIKAFRMNLEGKAPAGSKGLDKLAIAQYSAELYALDGKLAYERANEMAKIYRSFSASQKAALSRLKFGDSSTWPELPDPLDRRGMSHEVNVAVMTYASEMFSWVSGSLETDTYFCPERHGMYFGGFGMKTAPAMGKKNYSISTTLTGNSGENFIATLSDSQRRHVTALPDLQRQDLAEIVRVRREISSELRRFLKGEVADKAKVLALSRRYGELDGNLSYLYASVFAKIGQTLTPQQLKQLQSMRASSPNDPRGPFLYSTPINLPKIENVEGFFGIRR